MQTESVDLIGIFQSQSERLEAQFHEQLHNRRVIEHYQAEVISTACMVQSLEQQAQAQAQQIELNLQRALRVYEQAREMRRQQIQLDRVVEYLRHDLGKVRQCVSGEFSEGETVSKLADGGSSRRQDDAAASGSGAGLGELPSLAELLPARGGQQGTGGRFGAPAASAQATRPPSVGPTETALEALALLSTVASTSSGFNAGVSNMPRVASDQQSASANATGLPMAAATGAPEMASESSSSSYRGREPSPLAPPLEQQQRASCGHAGHVSSGTHRSARKPASGSSADSAMALSPASSRQASHPTPSGCRHTTLTEHSLTAHDGGMAAAGMAGPGAMGMWTASMGGARAAAAAAAADAAAASQEHGGGRHGKRQIEPDAPSYSLHSSRRKNSHGPELLGESLSEEPSNSVSSSNEINEGKGMSPTSEDMIVADATPAPAGALPTGAESA